MKVYIAQFEEEGGTKFMIKASNFQEAYEKALKLSMLKKDFNYLEDLELSDIVLEGKIDI